MSKKIPVPENLQYYNYQSEDILNILGKLLCGKNTLLNLEMGTGKTIEVCGLLNIAGANINDVLIICSAGLKLNWKNELEKWLTVKPGIHIVNGTEIKEADIVIINYDILSRNLKFISSKVWNMVVLDEAHKIKNPETARTKAVFTIAAGSKLLLTGTPILNRVRELWPLLKYLEPKEWGSYHEFCIRYCDAYKQLVYTKNKQGDIVKRNVWNYDGQSSIEELNSRLQSVMIQRRKADVLTELPDKIRQIIEIDPVGGALNALEEEKGYSQMVEELELGLRVPFTELAGVRLETALAKVPVVAEHIRDVLVTSSSRKLICFAHHFSVIRAIAEAFPGECVTFTGRTSPENKQKAVERFQTDPKIKLFIGNIEAAGTGITLTAANHVIFAELSFVPGELSQAEDRAHRIGQKNAVLVQHLVLAGSIDATMVRIVVRKQRIIDQLLINTELKE